MTRRRMPASSWSGMPHGADDARSPRRRRASGANISPLSMQYRHSPPVRGLLMGYAAASEAAMPSYFRRLAAAFEDAAAG